MLPVFYEQYLTTTGPDSKLNSTAIDIFTLYALMDFSFRIEAINLGRSIVYINGSQVIIRLKHGIFADLSFFMLHLYYRRAVL